jgi:hypothetical protein
MRKHYFKKQDIFASLLLSFFLSSPVFADMMTPPGNTPAPASSEAVILQHIATSVDQLSSQLVDMQASSQQNWQNYFKLEADVKFSPQDYPEWQQMQGDFSSIQNTFSPQSLNGLLNLSSQHIFNPALAHYSSEVDQTSLSIANGAINQTNQTNQNASGMADAVSVPLGSAWHDQLSSADQLQVLKAMSSQMSTNNALMYSIWQQNQTQQLLLSRLLIEITQLNQNIHQLVSETTVKNSSK